MSTIRQHPVRSPCVGICSTGIGDSVCRGCKRYMHEIIAWNSYSDAEKQAIINRISALLRQVAEPLVEIVDAARFAAKLTERKLRFDPNADPYVWFLEFLYRGETSSELLEDFGCRLRPEYAVWPLHLIKERIDRDFFALSQVHHERYFSDSMSES